MFFRTKFLFFCLSVNCFTTKPCAGLKQCINRFVFAAGLQQGLQQLIRAPLFQTPPVFNCVDFCLGVSGPSFERRVFLEN